MRALVIDAAGRGRFFSLAHGLAAAGHTVTLLAPAGAPAPAGVERAALAPANESEPQLMAHVRSAQLAVAARRRRWCGPPMASPASGPRTWS